MQDRVDVVNLAAGTDLGPNLDEYVNACGSQYTEVIAYPGAVRWPAMTYTTTVKDMRYKLKNLYSHVLFGVVLDALAWLSGTQLRRVKFNFV